MDVIWLMAYRFIDGQAACRLTASSETDGVIFVIQAYGLYLHFFI